MLEKLQSNWNILKVGRRVCKPCPRESGIFVLDKDILFGGGRRRRKNI